MAAHVPAGSVATNWHPTTADGGELYDGWTDITLPCRLGASHNVDRYGNLLIGLVVPNARAGEFFRYLRYNGLPLEFTLRKGASAEDPDDNSEAPNGR